MEFKELEQAKPCPFCGSLNLNFEDNEVFFWVVCDNCLAEGGIAKNREDAVKVWNTRIKEE